MTVTIDPNIKKQRIFIDKNGNKITEEQMFGGMGNDVGADRRTNQNEQGEKNAS